MVDAIIQKSPLILKCTYMGQTLDHEVGFIKPLDQTLRQGDICLFYGTYSIITKIQNPDDPYESQVASLDTECVVTEDDADFLKKKPGDLWWMSHGFSLKQLIKVIPITDRVPDYEQYTLLENKTRKECSAVKQHKYDECKCWTSEIIQPECRIHMPRIVRGKLVILEQ